MPADYQLRNPQLDTEINHEGSGFVTVWKIPYEVTDGPAQGVRGHVTVPAEQYNANTVHAAVRQAVDAHQDVMGR